MIKALLLIALSLYLGSNHNSPIKARVYEETLCNSVEKVIPDYCHAKTLEVSFCDLPIANHSTRDSVCNPQYANFANGVKWKIVIDTSDIDCWPYDDSGIGIFGRRVAKAPNLGSIISKKDTGLIVLKLCINPHGQVIKAQLNRGETTIKDKTVLNDALRLCNRYSFEQDVEAPAEQCGKFTFRFDPLKPEVAKHNEKKVSKNAPYDDSGIGIFGRRIIKTPSLAKIMTKKVKGDIVLKMCIDPEGKVIRVELNRDETTITDQALMKEALRVAKNYVYEKNIDAPAEQCGKFTFRLDINGLY